MAADTSANGAQDQDFPAHARSYDRFISILKVSVIWVAIITAVVVYIIAT